MALFKDNQKIKVRIFMEVMGWPKEGLNEHLKKVISLLSDKFNWKISKEDYSEPEKASEKMFGSHVEFEAELSDYTQLFSFALSQGPSVIEVIEPSELYLTAGELQDILAEMVSKAKTMDKDIKYLAAQNKQFMDAFAALEKKGILKKQPLNDEKSEK